MRDGGRIAGALVLLMVLWIGVYWWWPAEPKITIAQGDDAVRGVTPKRPSAQPPTEPAPDPKNAKPDPKSTPAKEPAVIPPEFTTYTVKNGDTYASIAKEFFGSEALAGVIVQSNPLMSPEHLSPGRTILIPKDPNNIQGVPVKPATDPADKGQAPPPAADRVYVVKDGDSLSKISKEVYGESKWSSLIFEANKDQLAREDAIKPGQHLKIPPKPQR
jgi:nucleoid-associated protein YgaU